jgi:uncharacterized protein YjbI with pentapeptide repeats
MADPELVQLLVRGGTQGLLVWRERYPDRRLDLSSANLDGRGMEDAPFENADLRGAILSNCRLDHSNFTDADLTGANLTGTSLSGAQLTNATLSGANLQEVILTGADLSGARCDGTNFANADLQSTKYEGASFRGANFNGAFIPPDLIKETDCQGARFQNIDLTNIDLSGRNFTSCDFSNARLGGARLAGTTLVSVNFNQARLEDTDMTGADCESASFQNAQLPGVCLLQASLRGSNLSYANLEGANIANADFYEALLGGARMAKLNGAPEAINLITTNISNPVYYFETAVLNPIDRWVDWERIRIAGRLPLFAASYSALVAIPLFFYLLEIYNDKIGLLRAWAEDAIGHVGIEEHGLAHAVLQRLHPLPVPELSALLLVSTVFLAIGATIYALGCPSRVKEFSRDQWKYQLGLSAVHYLTDAWRRRWLRVAALFFYSVGGLGAAAVLFSKLGNVIAYLLRNPAWSF